MIDRLLSSETHWWLFFAGTIILFLLIVEAGFLIGRWRHQNVDPDVKVEKKSQTGTVLAALLALLGFLLAISFGTAADRFAERKELVLQEANAIGTTYLRADFLPEPQRSTAKKLLQRYVKVRLVPMERGREATIAGLHSAIVESEQIQQRLWHLADQVAAQRPRSQPVGLFIDSLNSVIDLHEERVTVGMHFRIPPSLLWALYLVALLSMGIMGVHFGLAGTRNLVASVALVAAFAAVLLLIVDLDQVRQRLFTVPQSPMVDLQHSMGSTPSDSPPRGGGPTERSDDR